jgi:indole-3-glycerol phosphate synthase
MVDGFQVLEARATGADAILLIVAALADEDLQHLAATARGMELDVLCEVHDRAELERAVALGFTVVGVNSRNLHTMQVDPQTQIDLARLLPPNCLRVAESGIRNASDIASMRTAGYDAFLVGESLMREPDPAAALAALLQRDASPAL